MLTKIDRVFDFNVHLPIINSNNVNDTINQDLNLIESSLILGLSQYEPYLKQLEGFNLLLFNTNLFNKTVSLFNNKLKGYKNAHLTCLIDFRRKDIRDYIDILIKNDLKAIMVNSYIQKISNDDIELVIEVFKYCEEKNLKICIDGSYGTNKMLEYDNLRLMCFASEKIKKVPIVIIHSGGLNIKKVMLLALENSNIFLETSFSLPFYIDSSIENDFAFALKKIGIDRVFYGSDSPYLDPMKAFKSHLNFLIKYKFSSIEIDKFFYQNALKFF